MRSHPSPGRARTILAGTAAWITGTAVVLAAAVPPDGPEDLRLVDSRTVTPASPVAGPHAVKKLTVGNDGERVTVRVRHRRSAWRGTVEVTLRVPGEGPTRADRRGTAYVTQVRHAPRGRVKLTTAPADSPEAASPWRCRDVRAVSKRARRVTTVSVPRTCLDGAERVQGSVTVTSAGRQQSTASTRLVKQQSRPNILVFMVDDMRQDDLQYMPQVTGRIGGAGVTFENGMAPYPLCCPARASVMTGVYPHNHKVWSHREPYGFNSLDDSSTVATWLDDAGYHNRYLGKYLNGYGAQPAPDGSDPEHSSQYVPPGWDLWRASIDGGIPRNHPKDGGTYRFFDTTLTNHGKGYVALDGQYQTTAFGRLTRQAVREDSAKGTPWFNYVSFAAPHFGLPREPDDPQPVLDDNGVEQIFKTVARPNRVRGIFDDRIFDAPGIDWFDPDASDRSPELSSRPEINPDERDALVAVTRQRAESLWVVDQEIGRVLDELEATGEAEETFVLFTSDNGYYLGEQGVRQGKILPYEPALKVPMVLSGPGIPAGEVRQDPFLSIDLGPTLAHMGGAKPSTTVDGKSLLPAARRGDRGWNRPVLVETGPASVVRRTDESGGPLPPDADPGKRDVRFLIGIRTPRYLYTHRATGFEELYDLRLDPRQYDNLLDSDGKAPARYEEHLTLLKQQLRATRACDGSECRPRLPQALRTP